MSLRGIRAYERTARSALQTRRRTETILAGRGRYIRTCVMPQEIKKCGEKLPPLQHKCLRCAATVANTKWHKIRASSVGWFFSKEDEKLVFCPEHLPVWVKEWRKKCQEARQ